PMPSAQRRYRPCDVAPVHLHADDSSARTFSTAVVSAPRLLAQAASGCEAAARTLAKATRRRPLPIGIVGMDSLRSAADGARGGARGRDVRFRSNAGVSSIVRTQHARALLIRRCPAPPLARVPALPVRRYAADEGVVKAIVGPGSVGPYASIVTLIDPVVLSAAVAKAVPISASGKRCVMSVSAMRRPWRRRMSSAMSKSARAPARL